MSPQYVQSLRERLSATWNASSGKQRTKKFTDVGMCKYLVVHKAVLTKLKNVILLIIVRIVSLLYPTSKTE